MTKRVFTFKQFSTTSILVAFIVLVSICGIVAAYSTSNHNLVNALKLAATQSPESFTQLYFVNPAALPTYASPNKKQTVYFRIVNNSSKPQTYQYVINVNTNGSTSNTESKASIKAGEGTTIPFSFTIPQPSEQLTATISLIGTPDHLLLRSHS